MRNVRVVCVEDGVSFSLGSDVTLICEVMDLGEYISELTYQLKVKGIDLIELLNKHNINGKGIEINANNTYVITAYDW